MADQTTTPNIEGWLADLRCQQKQAGRAAVLLEHAVETLHAEQPNEDRSVKAQRLRGAAVVAQTAALELMATCGWLESVHAAEMQGLIADAEIDDEDADDSAG
jgi:hypothetical protein